MVRKLVAPTALLALVACGGQQAPSPPLDEAAHRAEVEKWRHDREERLRAEDGWLTLVGLYWLEKGENRFGTDPGNDLVFPAGSGPGVMGTFLRDRRGVRVEVAPGVEITHDGRPVTAMDLATDKDGEPTVLELGTLSFHIIERGDRTVKMGVRVKDRRASTLLEFAGIESYAVDPAWRIAGRFEAAFPPKSMLVPNILGTPTAEFSPGAVVLTVNGSEHRLDALPGPDGQLFLVFGDETNGEETYGGGRFLYSDPPDEDGTVIVDFNKAYNPPCVFTPYATCPLPPKQNVLPVAVTAGEKMYGEAH